jgi:uncharacterized protein (TIGR02679 family)
LKLDELQKAKDYFSSTKGFARLLKAMAQKYQSLGHWGGSVTLTSLKEEERDALSALFRADFSRQKSITISLERFAKALELTKFSDISALSLLEEIQGQSLLSNSDQLAQKERAKAAFFNDLASQYTQPYCQVWLQAIIDKNLGTRSIHTMYNTRLEQLRVQMHHVLSGLTAINKHHPNEIERLPIFARRITKDPHGFDSNSDTGRLLLQALKILNSQVRECDQLTLALSGTEELTELYYSFGLLRDDLWNFVTCTGITGNAADNQPLGYLTEAYRQQVTLNLPLREVVRIDKAFACAKVAYVVENPGVYSALLDLYRDFCEEQGLMEIPNPPLVCTHGQFKLASLLLLDKLATSGTLIYYSGDFDPEGLSMAERLLLRYPGQAKAWHYTLEDYLLSRSDKVISPQRLKQLDRVSSPELGPLKEKLLQTARAGYQEGILNELWCDVKQYMQGFKISNGGSN